jgi:hypothetical protein
MWRDRSKDTTLGLKKVRLDFVCHCKSCIDYVYKIFLISQLYIKDISRLINYKIINNDFLLYFNYKDKLTTLIDEFNRTYEIHYHIKEHINHTRHIKAVLNYYNNTYDTIATFALSFKTAHDMCSELGNNKRDYKTQLLLIKQEINHYKDYMTDFEVLCKQHDTKIILRNLNAYNLETTDPYQMNLIQQFYSFQNRLFTAFLNDEKVKADWKEQLRLKCCKGCALYGHCVEKCYTKHCYVICRIKNCSVDNCQHKLYKCHLDHCMTCYTHKPSGFTHQCKK